MITQYLQQVLGYRVEFKICLVCKILVLLSLNFCRLKHLQLV